MASPSLQSKNQNLDNLIENARHYGQLRNYVFDLGLPLLLNSAESPLSCRETTEELEAVDTHFSAQIRGLFNALEAFNDLNAKAVEEHKPHIHQEGLVLTVKLQLQSFDRYLACLHRTYHSHRLSLSDPAVLPRLPCVAKLRLFSAPNYAAEVHFADTRPISLRVPLELLVRLPALQELDCPWLWERMPIAFQALPLRHYTRPWEGPWRDSRHEFARAVRELDGQVPASLNKARLWFWRPSYILEDDQSAQMPNLVYPADVDPMSLGLRTIASHLEELDLRAFLMPDFFNVQIPWPRMKRLRVEFHPWRPDGCWYFVGPRGEDPYPEGFQIQNEHYPPVVPSGKDEEVDELWIENEEGYEEEERQPDMFRTEPLADKIEPLLAVFAKALKAMTCLDEAELFTYVTWKPSEKRQSEYGDYAPYDDGVHRWGLRYVPAKVGSKGLVEWQVGEWRPQGDVIQLFEALGGDSGVEVTWKPFDFIDSRMHDDLSAYI